MTPQEAITLVKECGLNIEGIKYVKCEKAILNALEKQIPKKPINREGTTYFYCPVCEGNRLNHYCADCGQALDWSE